MKFITLFQFYFPFILPRDFDWQGKYVTFQLPKYTSIVRPRNLDEELFPNEIDKTLASMVLTLFRVSVPTGSVVRRVQDMCLDRIEVRVNSELSMTEASQEDVQAELRDTAIRSCNHFIEHCRVVSRSPLLHGVQQEYRLEDSNHMILTPHSISWFDGETGEGLPVYNVNNASVNSTAISGAMLSPERGTISMAQIYQSLQQNPTPDLVYSLLLDAQERIITLRIREAILSMATACEVASNRYIQQHDCSNDAQVKRLLAQNKFSFAERRLNLVPYHISGRPLKLEDSATFNLVETIYRVRNNVAHEGRAFYKDGSLEIAIDAQIATRFHAAVEVAVTWLASL